MIITSAPALDPSTAHFNLDGQTVDVLDLKTLLIPCGINVPEEMFAALFAKYQLEPPGASGLNVCMCRDLSIHPQSADAACCDGCQP